MILNPELISVRDIQESDIPLLLDYWFRSPPGFIEGMGVDLAKMPTELEMRGNVTKRIRDNRVLPVSKLPILVITYDAKPIGVHNINPLIEADYGIFHAHIWNPTYRRQGLGLRSYPKACRLFMERFELKRILFKTPLQNTGSIRVKEKLGIRCIGEETVGFGIIKDGTRTKVFELNREELNLI